MSVNSVERGPVRRWLGRGLKLAVGLVIGLHLYALVLLFIPAPGTILMLQKTLESDRIGRETVQLNEISPHLIRAVIAAEDTGFCQHNGVDFAALKLAVDEYLDGEGLRGASTITQQTAKNIFLWNGGGVVRKIPEAWLAVFIDFSWGKRRVMEQYLNAIEWGNGLFGAEAAAWVRFGKPASRLTRHEAALLAAVLPNPSKWRLDPPGPYVRSRAATIEARMQIVERDGLDTCVLAGR